MSKRITRIFLSFIMIVALGVIWSCTQPEDVLVPITTSEVTLTPQLLPNNFPGMHYELWVASATETLSLGKFQYDNVNKKFLDMSGGPRAEGNLFVLDENIYKYSKMFVSIQNDTSTNQSSPGSIMLIDDVTNPTQANVDLVFPLSTQLWEATCRYNMETTSDSNPTQDGYGIWFASYQRLNDSIRDTLSLDSFTIDSTKELVLIDTIVGNLINVINILQKDTTRIFGVDSFTHTVTRYTQIIQYDTIRAGESTLVTDPTFYFTLGPASNFNYDQFTQDSFALPDYSAYGWTYKGWVISPYVSSSFIGEVTLPAWKPNSLNDSLMPGIKSLTPGLPAGLLTTGNFVKIDTSDGVNPYAMYAGTPGVRLPQFPGEDFLDFSPDPAPWIGPGGLVPFASGNSGTVFISIEPNNFVTDTTNFPLIPFMKEIPPLKSAITVQTVILNMWNRSETSDPRIGFPRIRVNIKAY